GLSFFRYAKAGEPTPRRAAGSAPAHARFIAALRRRCAADARQARPAAAGALKRTPGSPKRRNVPPRPPGRVSDTHRRQIDPPPRRDRHARRTTPERHETAQALCPRCPGSAPMRGAGGKRPRAGVPRVDATGGAPRVGAACGAPRVGSPARAPRVGRRGWAPREGAAAGRPARASAPPHPPAPERAPRPTHPRPSAPPRAAGGPYSPIRSATRARWLRASPHWWALDRPRLSHRCRSCSQVKPMPPWTCSDAAGTRQPASEA
ncbi:MAG: hypothetical protein QOI62_1750, partial [Solirubrobacteraceae bacterium]|nr:hypothetical protein [Solirubrobacteraceae bacterium]